ncbi:DNA polymerase III subunits gamma and tau [bacteria symbiont BFo1 of Frankliniella occidentalis]|jgi:DNA polymerase-3 subunit gamma/tau|uniref:DNA polymerase III subunit gamma/tau n=1 Tax=Erwinia aphidicola TaxID=68334 RepID=UPI0006646E83|nr:DNA polymerase III subunit gamma/tau [Erwinia aphidicola]KMV69404.1 DNA polymerase III subunits gamma and tau [bacteria symbiont BFo1 of Frankliniella occidentalis]PIJ55830.1 DNA polymerase III subunit gamma/tau [Erwinia sp. OLMDLW33]KYP84028.1 DNA polymerase III subunits gamma and tau [bacteria symbiont BFo1 of Frankliniella occidentalis]KYP89403.1 DNA polymerase III subunits gamma and tau [bacteria symbiont BFo1 of Frankliniella occidentalis]MBD1376801.1 DNA polymerase III subunit gamma/t
MSYQVLARKWRPQAFTDVVGQQHVLTALANGLSLGRIHHAYLFSGTRGVGKTTIARLLAKGLNCETGITATPCGQCDNCREIEQGRFVDLIEIDAASRTKVEDTRDLLDNVQYAPARGRFKVYLIDEVHMLSRHSFNALLKTLEEPPEHVKFLLATTDPQKLPVTILSRCLQFHLKALDQEQIRGQLEHVLKAEQIAAETRALQLLARAADGSMRDALSLTDQAIAMGQGQVTTATVNDMLGTLDDEQPLALIEALVNADGEQVMALLTQAASRGVEWEALLVEMLTLLHRVAMIQLLPSALGDDMAAIEQRLRELARVLPPADVQLYYQTLLMGRKELPLAPDRRMGVEMTLLRALAFHPKAVIAEPVARPTMTPQATAAVMPAPDAAPPSSPPAAHTVESPPPQGLPDTTSQLLQARTQLLRHQGASKPKKSEPAAQGARPASSALERLAAVTERGQQRLQQAAAQPAAPVKEEAYRWKALNPTEVKTEKVATPKALRTALELEKHPELVAKLVAESLQRDAWAAEIAALTMPKLVQQLALNAWKEPTENGICLHLRSSQRHLNSPSAQKALSDALNAASAHPIELTVVEDDNPAVLTPLEWRQKIYEEKLAQARQSIITDTHIQTLQRFFDADVDEESIRPV